MRGNFKLEMSSCSVEIIEFLRPEGNRKNLFISSIPGDSDADAKLQEQLYSIFSHYGLTHGIQIYPYPQTNRSERSGYYAFVTFYSIMAAYCAKESLNNKINIDGTECKIAFAKRKKEIQTSTTLHFSKCQELANYYLGFNGWSTTIKLLKEDDIEQEEGGDMHKVRYVCITRIDITGQHLHSEGMGAWEETCFLKDPTSKAKAICKSKKLAYQRSLENAFSKVLLIVLPNGKVTVEVDTTKPDLILTEKQLNEDNLLKINELDEQPPSDDEENEETIEDDIDAANLHILHELEEEM